MLSSDARLHFCRFGGHEAVQTGGFIKSVFEGDNDISVKQQSFAFAGIGDVGKLPGRNIQLFGKDCPVAARLVEHTDKVAVFKDVFDLPGGKQVLYILGDAGWNAAPLSKPLPNFDGVRRRLLFLQQQMKLVDVVAGCFMGIPVDGHAVPHLILHDEHPQLF